MTEVAQLIADMVRAGVDPELIGRAAAALAEREPVRIVDEQAERRRAKDRERKRLRNSAETAELEEVVSPKKETSPTPPKEKTTPSKSEPNGSSKTPRQALECVLDPEHAASVIDHRQRIRKPLTLKAAQLLAREFAKCPDPNAGADAMVLNGWQGFDPTWMDRKQVRGSPQPPAAPSQAEVFAFIGRNSSNDPGPEPDDSRSARQAISHLREVGSER